MYNSTIVVVWVCFNYVNLLNYSMRTLKVALSHTTTNSTFEQAYRNVFILHNKTALTTTVALEVQGGGVT